MNELSEEDVVLRNSLLDAIDRSARGMYVPMIKTLMAAFGYNANYRVRQSSLAEVTHILRGWGIGHEYSGGISSLDYIRLFRLAPETLQRRALSSMPAASTEERTFEVSVAPFEFAFELAMQ